METIKNYEDKFQNSLYYILTNIYYMKIYLNINGIFYSIISLKFIGSCILEKIVIKT